MSPDVVEQHLVTRVGAPFRRAALAVDQRRLDELRLFTTVLIEPRLEGDTVALEVAVTETLRLLPLVYIRVTDENGVSVGPGLRGINLLGQWFAAGCGRPFRRRDRRERRRSTATTITPGTWCRHLGFSYSSRRNTLYDFDERATSAEARFGRNWSRGLRTGAAADVLSIDTGDSGASLSPDGRDVIPTIGAFVTVDRTDSSTNPRDGWWAEAEIDRLFGDAASWTFILDGRRFQRLARSSWPGAVLARHPADRRGRHEPAGVPAVRAGRRQYRARLEPGVRGRLETSSSAPLEYTYVLQPVRSFSVAG